MVVDWVGAQILKEDIDVSILLILLLQMNRALAMDVLHERDVYLDLGPVIRIVVCSLE